MTQQKPVTHIEQGSMDYFVSLVRDINLKQAEKGSNNPSRISITSNDKAENHPGLDSQLCTENILDSRMCNILHIECMWLLQQPSVSCVTL